MESTKSLDRPMTSSDKANNKTMLQVHIDGSGSN